MSLVAATRTYRLTFVRRVLNVLVRGLILLGAAPRAMHLLTVRGRRTGEPHSTPVTFVEDTEGRWLVAPYGAVGWVRNARAAGEVSLQRGRRSMTVPVMEVEGDEAARVLQAYLRKVRVARPYFTAAPESPVEAFAAELSQHPVFRLSPQTPRPDERPQR